MVDQLVARDGVDPTREGLVAIERCPLGVDRDQGLLHQILHLGGVIAKTPPEIGLKACA